MYKGIVDFVLLAFAAPKSLIFDTAQFRQGHGH